MPPSPPAEKASTRHPIGSIIRLIDDGSEMQFFGQPWDRGRREGSSAGALARPPGCPAAACAPLASAGWLAGRLLFSALFAGALAQPTDEPSDHERGQQERDDHARADEHIGENYSGAALDGHDARRRLASMPLYGQWSGSPRRFNALSCFNVRLDSLASWLSIRHVFAYRLRRLAPSTCARHAPNA